MKFLWTKTSVSSYKPIEINGLEELMMLVGQDEAIISNGLPPWSKIKKSDKEGAVGVIEIYDDYRE